LAGSSRAPGNCPAETEEREREDEHDNDHDADQLAPLACSLADYPFRLRFAGFGMNIRMVLLTLLHKPILRVETNPNLPFAGCSRSGSAAQGRVRETRRAREQTDWRR